MSGDVFPAITEEYVDNLFNYQEKTYNFPLFRSGSVDIPLQKSSS